MPAPRVHLSTVPFSRRVTLVVALVPFLLFVLGIVSAVLCVRSFALYVAVGPDYHLGLSTFFALAAFALIRNFGPYSGR